MDTSTTPTRGRGGPPIDRTGCTAHVHGDYSAYRQGCRCDDARNDDRIYRKRRREGRHPARMIDATGTARRLQALAVIGWSTTELGPRLDAHPNLVQRWRVGNRPVNRSTAIKVAALYGALQGTPGPSGVTRVRAQSFGWVPPLLWDGINIDNPAAVPHVDDAAPPRSRIDLDDVDYLLGSGISLEEIAERLGVTVGAIERAQYRARERVAA